MTFRDSQTKTIHRASRKKRDPEFALCYLKKCAPTIRSRDLVFSPTKLRSIVEVLVARTQLGEQYFSRSANICCFKDTFSMTAYNEIRFNVKMQGKT